MKKILFWSAVTLFAAVSCNKVENDAPVQESNVPSFVASVDGADTKTVIDGMKSYWNGTEGIRVLDGTLANGKVYTATVEKSQTATFTEVDGSVSLDEDAAYLAVYPEGPAGSVTWDGDVASSAKKFWLPGDQTATEGSYDPSTHIAVAYTEAGNTNLEFKNVVSLVKFTLQSDNVSEVCFYGNNSDVIAGNFDVTYNNGNPAINTKDQYNLKYAKITGNLEKGKTYYISVLPCEFEGGFSIETIAYGAKGTKRNSKEYTLARNQILDLEDVSWTPDEDATLEWTKDTETLKQWWGDVAYLYAWTDDEVMPLGAWPGTKMNWDGTKFSAKIPKEYIGKKLNFKVHNDSGWEGSNKAMDPVWYTQSYKGNADFGLK
ncbi:MAG: hypothetical protein E7118_00430 [Bacteroidales bacterium]|nr:hypothetical protein [Bacteroidales bacterium]